MPRAPHRHGGAVHARGISGLKVCIVCGANDAGDGVCRLADRGRPGDEALKEAVRDLGPGTWVAADAHQGYRRVLPALGIAGHAATRTDLQKDGELGMASALHQRLSIFLAGFHGVSTKWLTTACHGSCGSSRRDGRTPTGSGRSRARAPQAPTSIRAAR